MYDYQLVQLFIPIIQNGLIAAGFGTIPVIQAPQPTLEGVSTEPTVYYNKVGDHQYGFLSVKDGTPVVDDEVEESLFQNMETTFQISVLSIQNPDTPTQFTASDIANRVALIMKSPATIKTLIANGVGIYRIQDVRNPYFSDDRDQSEASPNFDFTLTHKLGSVSNIPTAQSVQPGIFGV